MTNRIRGFSTMLWPRCCGLSWHGRVLVPGAPAALTPSRPCS